MWSINDGKKVFWSKFYELGFIFYYNDEKVEKEEFESGFFFLLVLLVYGRVFVY